MMSHNGRIRKGPAENRVGMVGMAKTNDRLETIGWEFPGPRVQITTKTISVAAAAEAEQKQQQHWRQIARINDHANNQQPADNDNNKEELADLFALPGSGEKLRQRLDRRSSSQDVLARPESTYG
ncbi:GM19917 [Drosophila sechellia]|uniref:GM19917 n=1 Tax=Drosophila sechellia TaxID=7238 RepID=B4HNK7_DROSE|nr:GM19917 [Drosophila sechellia]